MIPAKAFDPAEAWASLTAAQQAEIGVRFLEMQAAGRRATLAFAEGDEEAEGRAAVVEQALSDQLCDVVRGMFPYAFGDADLPTPSVLTQWTGGAWIFSGWAA